MVRRIEVLNYESNNWVKVGDLSANNKARSISDTREQQRQVYIIQCESDDVYSRIYRLKSGTDVANLQNRIIEAENLELIKELKRGECYVMQVKNKSSQERKKNPRTLRLL